MKFVFGIVLVCWGLQFLLEALFGLYIPLFRVLLPFFIIFWGVYLIRQSEWVFEHFPRSSEVKVSNSERVFFLNQSLQNRFVITSSDCTFDSSTILQEKSAEFWIAAKKSRIVLKCNSDAHTIIHLFLNRSSVQCSNQLLEHQTHEGEQTIHIGKTDQKPTIFFSIKAKESVINIL